MKVKWNFILTIFILINFSALGQKHEIHFHSINSFALIGGERKISTGFQTLNGIRTSDWFSGIGIGIDNYQHKTLPLFFDVRKYFGSEKKAFVYGDLGYNFPMKDKPGKEIYYYNTYHFTGGVYTDVGIGYQLPLYKKISFLISGGYSHKKLQSKIGVNICGIAGSCFVDYSTYDFSYSRMILKAALVF